MLARFIIFLLLNFGGLALGSLSTKAGVSSQWYVALQKAPWTPPGWVFGVAWSVIMLCFSYYMAKLLTLIQTNTALRNTILKLYGLQWILNVSWNYVFFKYYKVVPGLAILCLLLIIIGYLCYSNAFTLKKINFYLAPYLLWLLVAISLNGYIYWYN